MKYIAALLTVHNRCKLTLACLNKLYAQDIPEDSLLDVYLVDDGSTDGTAQEVANQYPQAHIISADGSLYWNRGMHRAWEVAAYNRNYDYYLWLNDDTDLLTNALVSLMALSTQNSDNAIIVGATCNKQGDQLTYGGRVGKQIAPCDGNSHEVERFNGNIVWVPQAVYHVLGNLDYYYRHSKGDIDYGIRARKQGIKIFQCGDVLGICDAHEHIDNWCNPAIPFRKRWHLMHMPNGMPPCETFHLEKQVNLLMACVHFCTIYIRCMFPQIWLKRAVRR